ncbi:MULTISPECIES: gephyrin-like molybdotransferase Glp [Paracoccus]|uniref:molybdopterin molybdotransferase MoeA n=1 Tax=Paracoccus TaxID=265 RepID=UPI00086C5A30|nr:MULTISPECIES: gephyrin-like molybdotransferase Glp [Paracoccus]ODT58985.1 MAG: molybdopterin molybdenumtransferase MoeA [Paracoccus sp. SCN 68-21]
MISVEQALAHVLALAPAPHPETVALEHAHGRVLLEPAVAAVTQPPFDASAMDGYALRRADLPGPLDVIGTSAAGHPWTGEARPGTAIRIFTGAPVPAGYDHVELQENILRDGDRITVQTRSTGSNIRARGNDFAAGDRMEPGRILGAAQIGLLAAMNVAQVTVARAPQVVILAGGDELVPPGTTPAPGQIISSNDLALAALAREAGAVPRILPIARDTPDSLRDSFRAAEGADLLVTIGGASVGDHDLVAKIAAEQGIVRSFYKVALRPGKPLMAGQMGAGAMLGLPGNPVSAMVCGVLFMQPLIRAMLGLEPGPLIRTALLGRDLPAEGPRQHYLRASLAGADDLPQITPYDDQDSARLTVMSDADALLIRPPEDPARKAGDRVSYIALRSDVLPH